MHATDGRRNPLARVEINGFDMEKSFEVSALGLRLFLKLKNTNSWAFLINVMLFSRGFEQKFTCSYEKKRFFFC